MNGLAALQRDFVACLRGEPNALQRRLTGSPRAGLETMLGVYRHAYAARLVEALATDFPKLRALAGATAFETLARAYIARHPSRSPSLRWLGGRLAAFLAETPPYAATPALAEMAAFEWALAHAFDAADAPAAAAAALSALPPAAWPGLRLQLHPSALRLDLATPVPALWRRIEDGPPPDRPETALAPPAPCGTAVPWLVWRDGLTVKFRPLETDEAAALAAVEAGADFAALCEAVAAAGDPEQAALRAAAILRGWLESGLIVGIVTAAPISA